MHTRQHSTMWCSHHNREYYLIHPYAQMAKLITWVTRSPYSHIVGGQGKKCPRLRDVVALAFCDNKCQISLTGSISLSCTMPRESPGIAPRIHNTPKGEGISECLISVNSFDVLKECIHTNQKSIEDSGNLWGILGRMGRWYSAELTIELPSSDPKMPNPMPLDIRRAPYLRNSITKYHSGRCHRQSADARKLPHIAVESSVPRIH